MSPKVDEPQLLYLEPDDEITSVIRRLRGADAGRIVLVAPGRSRATSSVIALRLLARAAADASRSVALVADASTRALAGEAGIAAFASVAEATSPTPTQVAPIAPTRAPIHVVRGAAPVRSPAARRPPATDGLDETVAVHLPPAAKASGGSRRTRRRRSLPAWPWLAGLLIVAVAAGAALLPGATVGITPATVAVGPQTYPISLPPAGRQTGELQSTQPGTATGQRPELVPATGVVTFFNRSTGRVDIPEGTRVSAGGTIVFATTKKITVPGGAFFGDPGQKDVDVVAVEGGTSGNVAAGAIDTIEDPNIRFNRRVSNAKPTTGGTEIPHTVIQQSDVDAVVAAINADLAAQLTEALASEPDRAYAGPTEGEVPVVKVPDDLIDKEDTPTFELSGTLSFDRAYVLRADVGRAASDALTADTTAIPAGKNLVPGSISVEIGTATAVGDEITVQVLVRAAAAAPIDADAVRDLVAGKTVDEAQAALRSIGDAEVDLWPAWLDRLPRLPFRISVDIVAASPDPSASP